MACIFDQKRMLSNFGPLITEMGFILADFLFTLSLVVGVKIFPYIYKKPKELNYRHSLALPRYKLWTRLLRLSIYDIQGSHWTLQNDPQKVGIPLHLQKRKEFNNRQSLAFPRYKLWTRLTKNFFRAIVGSHWTPQNDPQKVGT